jgi:hypothetical protein
VDTDAREGSCFLSKVPPVCYISDHPRVMRGCAFVQLKITKWA